MVDLFVSCGKLTIKFEEIVKGKGIDAGLTFLDKCVRRKQLTQENLERIKGYVTEYAGRTDVVLSDQDRQESKEQSEPSS